MTELLLRQVVAHIEQLPPEQQDTLAEVLWSEVEDREWDALVAKPASQRFLELLASEAREEDATGRTRDAGDHW